jgi:hypothetical protein
MNKEELIKLGLSEEQADSVIKGYGKMVPITRLNDKIEELRVANETIGERDNQIADLIPKAAGNENFQNEITQLQQANKTAKEQYETELAETRLINAMKLFLTGKVHNVDIAISQLDKSKVVLDESGNVKEGLEDQFTALKESMPFLAIQEEPQQQQPPSWSAGGHTPLSDSITKETFSGMSYFERVQLKQSNPTLYNEMTGKKEG